MKKKMKGDGLTRQVLKPRHGIRMHCAYCSWRFRAGGIETKKQVRQIEKDQKLVHQRLHKQVRRPDIDPESTTLQIERDYHAAEITHFFDETNQRQTTTSTTYVDVPGAAITNGLAANQDNLVIVAAQMDMSTTGDVGSLRMMRGTSALGDSEMSMECVAVGNRMMYNYWGVFTPTATETIKMQYKASAGTVGVDLITISVIRLSPDLITNTDYKYVTNTTDISFSTFGADVAGASVNITPSTANHRWLIMAKARYGTGIDPSTSVRSRIERSGVTVGSNPMCSIEGEDGTLDQYVLMTVRTDTLTAQSHTYQEISQQIQTTTGTLFTSRTDSAIFILDLDKFKHANINQEDETQELPNSTTGGYAENVHTMNITTAQTGDVLCLGYVTMDAGSSNTSFKMRLQVNDTDPQDLPTPTTDDVTTKAYDIQQWTTEDRIPVLYCYIENLIAATHKLDIDGSVLVTGTSRGTHDRNLTAFSMEMSSTELTQVKSEIVGINEQVVRVLTAGGQSLVKIISEQVRINESGNKILGNTTNYLTPSNFQLRLSGGASNIDPMLSLGGEMSTVIVPASLSADYKAADFKAADYITVARANPTGPTGFLGLKLFDDVTLPEATSGDTTPDHRCFYIYNSHSNLTMDEVKIWFSDNTQGDDYVEMGLGNSAVGTSTIETAIADEGTPPSPAIVFSTATSESTALTITNIPPLNHKAIWLRRTVPLGTNNPILNNKYIIMAKFLTNHI